MRQNYYGSLCTEMYEILHREAPQNELDFYLSYAKKGMAILEPLCGSGRFLIPFLERGYNIRGIDLSTEMLARLREKAPNATVYQEDVLKFEFAKKFDYIFISSGSVSLFTDLELCKKVLLKMKLLLNKGGIFVFAVDTVFDRCPNDIDCKTSISVKTDENFDLLLKSKNYYDEQSQTQFSPSIYELYDGKRLIRSEPMDFQTHLYKFGEMEGYLKELGFSVVKTYSSFGKDIAVDDECEMFLFECKVDEF